MMGMRMPQKYLNSERVPAPCAPASAFTGLAFAGFVFAGLVLAAPGAARADDTSSGAYSQFFTRMMSNVGLRSADPDIEYRERPPLVVPPSRDLPQPAAAGSPATRNAAWPADTSTRKRRAKTDGSVIAGEKADAPVAAGPTATGRDTGGVWKNITTLGGAIGGGNESAQFVHEPARNTLTDPPSGYRTPSPVQPYGITTEKQKKSDIDKQADIINGNPNAERH
jgi:hypothetical protein